MIYWGASGTGASPSFFSANLAISGTGTAQTHAISVIVGTIASDSQGRPFHIGYGAGTSLTSSTEDFHSYAGTLSTQDAADGSDFFGTDGPKYAVLEASDVNDSDVVLSRDWRKAKASRTPTFFRTYR